MTDSPYGTASRHFPLYCSCRNQLESKVFLFQGKVHFENKTNENGAGETVRIKQYHDLIMYERNIPAYDLYEQEVHLFLSYSHFEFNFSQNNLWTEIFEWQRSIWPAVLPYCLLNTCFMLAVEILHKEGICIAFNPSGHKLMTLIVSFLVINKVNLAYERFMQSRHVLGRALSSCRQLNQVALLYTEHLVPKEKTANWRYEVVARIVELLEATIRVIQDPRRANYLARNDDPQMKTNEDDPMVLVEALRFHLFNVNRKVNVSASMPGNDNIQESAKAVQSDDHHIESLDLFERMKLMDPLNEFVVHYDNLLKYSSTPLPFQLVQMSRTFLFLWTFTIPLVLRGFVEEMYSAMIFVFFLTYGFVGLELISTSLMNPFENEGNILNVVGVKEAAVLGIQKDIQLFSSSPRDTPHQFRPRTPCVEYGLMKDCKSYHVLPSFSQ